MTQRRFRIAVIGAGAIGRNFANALPRDAVEEIAFVDVRERPEWSDDHCFTRITSVKALAEWSPHVVVECAGHDAVSTLVPQILEAGLDVVLSSIGALADPQVRKVVNGAIAAGGARLVTIAGAVGGIDALAAASQSGLSEVTYTGRKPPKAWHGTAADKEFDLDSLRAPTVIFSGTAERAALKYPQNANVAATIALHGLGFKETTVTLIADPTISKNFHEIYAKGKSGELRVATSNEPSPENPKTSWLAALSLQVTVMEKLNGMRLEA